MCKLCGSKTKTEYDKQTKCHFHFCDKCGFIYKEDDDLIDVSLEMDHYSKHDNNFENKGYVKMFNDLLDQIDDYIDYSGLILDYGCGPGPVLSELMKQRGGTVKTYDLYFPHSEDYSEYHYDIITVTEVIEHFKQPLKDLKKIVNLLKPNGKLVIRTMFIQEPFFDWWYRRDYTHVTYYNDKVFEFIAEKFGLKIIYSDNYNTIILQKYK
ncbi:class I SAM-dependent methyltransferase [Mycoplasmatota bacterium WC44]